MEIKERRLRGRKKEDKKSFFISFLSFAREGNWVYSTEGRHKAYGGHEYFTATYLRTLNML